MSLAPLQPISKGTNIGILKRRIANRFKMKIKYATTPEEKKMRKQTACKGPEAIALVVRGCCSYVGVCVCTDS